MSVIKNYPMLFNEIVIKLWMYLFYHSGSCGKHRESYFQIHKVSV